MTEQQSAPGTGTARVKRGMAEMLKGGVIMDVVTPDQAQASPRTPARWRSWRWSECPADIRAQGGVSRMSDPDMIDGIIAAVSIPVMAKARIGHFVEAQVLQSAGRRLHRRVRSADSGRLHQPHRQVGVQRCPFVCGATNLGEAMRRITEGAAMIRSKGEAGTGDVSNATTHMRQIRGEINAACGR
jgi:pyridoxal 5'-phosphate synthase pdxS subunit